MTRKRKIRFGIVGYGNIGRTHVETLSRGAINNASVAAVVSQSAASLPEDVARVATVNTLLTDDLVDAVIVATPTMSHVEIGHEVLASGKHLIMEKPIAMSVAGAAGLVASVPQGTTAAVMLNQRYEPTYRKIQEIVESGALGRLVRFNWLMTAWYRPDVYFQVSSWRGTWPGEGGGVLMNQCIHNLDVLQWILGKPASVVADARFGKFHQIDVEDEVSALFNYADGMSGVVVVSTGEAPGCNQLNIVGDLASLQYDGETLRIFQADGSVAEHCASTDEMFGVPNFSSNVVEVETSVDQHISVLQDVVDSILDGKPPATPLASGLDSIELANAMLLSAWERRWITLPLDPEVYQAQLDVRIKNSALREAKGVEVHIDMDASYR